ncbi:MAG: ABC transporter permease [Cytophagales bacterium]|nr:ABC transporter permease [Cytophagales bacterium]
MSNIPKDQISDWLKKLERESWQLELLVSAFTIFLLIMATGEFDAFLTEVQFNYNASSSTLGFIFLFLALVHQSLQALTACLIGHLMLRGFWIGTIGLRSVQSSVDFSTFNYSEFFTKKLKEKVISLDQLVIKLDEICSVIFAFAFLVISILMAFGLYLLFIGAIAVFFNSLVELFPAATVAISYGSLVIMLTLMLSGLIYMIDYFTLGFFKRIKWFSKIYYPFYRFYNVITLSSLSRSIYYYMISKFSKKKIRLVYAFAGLIMFFLVMFEFDQHQYFPNRTNEYFAPLNSYDDQRPEDDYIGKISIASSFYDRPHFQVFLRYDAADNSLIKGQCEDFVPLKDDGLNWKLSFKAVDGNVSIGGSDYSDENFEKLLDCQSSIYQISINDSVYQDLNYHFYVHPAKEQKGLLTTIPTDAFLEGENLLKVKKIQDDSTKSVTDFASVPFWYKTSN